MVLPRFVHQALAGRPLTIFGSGSQTRCFAAAAEVSEALVQLTEAADSTGSSPLVVNVGSDREISILELAELVLARTGSPAGLHQISYDQAYGGKYLDQVRRVPDLSRLTGLLGWRPDRPLPDLIDDLVAAV